MRSRMPDSYVPESTVPFGRVEPFGRFAVEEIAHQIHVGGVAESEIGVGVHLGHLERR